MCKISAATIAADGKAVGTALEQIANAIQAEDPSAASALNTAGQGIIEATANWQEGSATAILEDAENAAIVALDLIPLTAPYADLVAIAFDALNILIANTSTQPAQAAAGSSTAKLLIVAKAANANPTNSQWFGKANIEVHHGDFRKGFEDAWATGAAAHSEYGFTPITV
jgi:hypothetical protein